MLGELGKRSSIRASAKKQGDNEEAEGSAAGVHGGRHIGLLNVLQCMPPAVQVTIQNAVTFSM